MTPEIQIYAPVRSQHQVTFGSLLHAGMRRHGVKAGLTHDRSHICADTVVCWGWRQGRLFHEAGKRVLVMERGYIGDRFHWTSLGWGGLNGNGAFHTPADGGARFRQHFPAALTLDHPRGKEIVIMGQVRTDAALSNYDVASWYKNTAVRLKERFGLHVTFRPHPKHVGAPWLPTTPRAEGSLADVLRRAALVVAFNSNSIVDAALAGVDTMAGNSGAMAWPVVTYRSAMGPERRENVEAWAHAMAWTQWSPEEIERGDAWEIVRQVPLNAKPMHAQTF